LVRLLPREPSADLEYELVSTRLSDAPDYRALSYVWGSRIPEATIRCIGETIIITKNCDYALRRLRNRYPAAMLWIDAIAINQKDLKERGQQVKIMGLIYRQATSVIICLGPAQDDDFEKVKRDVLMFSDMINLPLSRGLTLQAVLDLPLQPDVEGQLSAHDFDAWKRFWKLPYWTRTWVVQEVGLASKAMLMYGDGEIEWADLMSACTWTSYSGHLHSQPSGSAVRSSWAGYDHYNRSQFSLRGNDLTSEITFLDCLDSARRGRKSTDPRDMVYAFLEHPNSHRFTPDYFHSVELVYYNFAVSCLNEYKNPSVLSYATRSTECESIEEMPTWCPVWNDRGQLPNPLLGLNRSNEYKTSAATLFQYDVTGRRLTTTGVHLGAVEFATLPISSHHIQDDDANPHSQLNPLVEAFQASRSSASGCAEMYPDLLKSFAGALTAGKGTGTDVEALLGHNGPQSNASNVSQWYRKLEGGDYHASLNRCFFILQQGYMGIGPPNMQKGDICSVVFGAKVAYILRGNGDGTHQLVGESYVEGIVDGRVISMVERGELRLSPIILI
jgi:hypothetical protein